MLQRQNIESENLSFSGIASLFFKYVPKEVYSKILSESFTKVKLGPEQSNFLGLGWPYIFTLNIDDGIERCSQYSAVGPYRKLASNVTDLDVVFKLHGDVLTELAYDDPPNVIFSRDQYIQSLERNESLLSLFSSDYTTKNFIFIGCSLDDEIDIQYAISRIKVPSGMERIYVTGTKPSFANRSKLEDFGITTVLVVSSYEDFYVELHKTATKSLKTKPDKFDQFSIGGFQRIPQNDLNSNKRYLLDHQGLETRRSVFPGFTIRRNIEDEITKALLSGAKFQLVVGGRFVGKTTLLRNIANQLPGRDVLYFPSDVSLTTSDILVLHQRKNSVVIIDSNVLSIDEAQALANTADSDSPDSASFLVALNRSESITRSILERSTVANQYHTLEKRLSESEVHSLNDALDKCRLIRMKENSSRTFLDHTLSAVNAYNFEVPHKKLSDEEIRLILILAVSDKVYSVVAAHLGTGSAQLESFSQKFSPYTETASSTPSEMKFHSGMKVVANSRRWILHILKAAIMKDDGERVANNIVHVVAQCTGDGLFSRYGIPLYFFDNLNIIFDGSERRGFIDRIYESLEDVLASDPHFWIQRAKGILRLERRNLEKLESGAAYAIKAFSDTGNERTRSTASFTAAMSYSRIAAEERYNNPVNVINAVRWSAEAFKDRGYNRKYIDTLLRPRDEQISDAIALSKHVALNSAELPSGSDRRDAEQFLNIVREFMQRNRGVSRR